MDAQRASEGLEPEAGRTTKPFSSGENPLGTPKQPIYPSQSPSQLSSHLDETFEGFAKPEADAQGMANLEGAENFGSRFQMPEQDARLAGQTRPDDSRIDDGGHERFASAELDLQATVERLQDLVARIRANLDNPEQRELESLLAQGAEILSTQGRIISRLASQQVDDVKREVKENPYRSLISALKIGMAVSQIYSAHRQGRLEAGSASGEFH